VKIFGRNFSPQGDGGTKVHEEFSVQAEFQIFPPRRRGITDRVVIPNEERNPYLGVSMSRRNGRVSPMADVHPPRFPFGAGTDFTEKE